MNADSPMLADTPATRCLFYRRTCGLPAIVQPDIGRIVFTAGHMTAITMPAEVGARVRLYLRDRNIAVGPIISHPRSKRWTYVVRADMPDEVRLFSELFRLNVSVARLGAQVALPSPTARNAVFRTWVESPVDTFRPSGMVVVEAIRACTAAAKGRGTHG